MSLADFLSFLSLSDVPKAVSTLTENGIMSFDDLKGLDDEDRGELIKSVSTLSIGDRSKLKKMADKFDSFTPSSSSSSGPPPPSGKEVVMALPDSYDSDKFAFLEKQLLDLTKDEKEIGKLWKDVDCNGNGIVSVAELDKWIKNYYPLLDNKKAMLHAHRITTKVQGDGDDWIQRDEFAMLLVNLFYYNKLTLIFETVDQNNDNRISFEEFVAGLNVIGFGIERDTAWKEFCKMDDNRGGHILFDEFCHYVAAKQWPAGFDAYYATQAGIGKKARKSHPGNKIHGRVAGKKGLDTDADIHTTKFDKLEQHVLSTVYSKAGAKKLFRTIDDNHSGKISKSELTRWLKKTHPEANDKDAIAYAFKKTNEDGDGDKYVQPDEFRSLFYNLFYFLKLKFVFSKIDKNHDSTVSFQEFTKSLVWLGLTLDTESAREEFDSIDAGGGGNGEIDFAELCDWVARKKIPVD